jgi:hypothetical protein
MTDSAARSFALASRGGPGLACDVDGVALGPMSLVDSVHGDAGLRRYRERPSSEMTRSFRLAYGPMARNDLERRLRGVTRVAQLLQEGEDARARIHAVLLGFPDIAPDGMAKLAAAASLRKDNPDWEDEPRVSAGNPDGGQWTSGGDGGGAGQDGGAANQSPTFGAAIGADFASDLIGGVDSLLGDIGDAAISGLETLGADLSGPAAILGFDFIPTNSSLTATGTLPGQPDIDYHLDQDTGQLLLYRNGDLLFDGMPGSDGLFHGSDGSVFGREVNGSIVLDPDSLPGDASQQGTADESVTGARSEAAKDADSDQPKLCPDPSADRPGGKSDRALAYQEQITGLPRGLAVELNGVVFDGCRESDGTMLEAKGPGYAWAMTGPDRWMTNYTGLGDILNQAAKQSAAAGDRPIEWHFAEQPVADYFREVFQGKGWSNITVFYTPYFRGER